MGAEVLVWAGLAIGFLAFLLERLTGIDMGFIFALVNAIGILAIAGFMPVNATPTELASFIEKVVWEFVGSIPWMIAEGIYLRLKGTPQRRTGF